jgi:hypothetical protein
MTEEQKFELVKTFGDLEIRRYLPYVAADVTVEGEFQTAGNKGFRPLANYIFSNNIAMTAPVIVEATDSNAWQVSFVMPDQSNLENMPTPKEGVQLRSSDGEICAAIKFRGYTSHRKVQSMTEKLMRLLAANGITPTGRVRVARFDPPWKPGIARHNEVIVPISY